jgi:hypothetical protein
MAEWLLSLPLTAVEGEGALGEVSDGEAASNGRFIGRRLLCTFSLLNKSKNDFSWSDS